MSRIVFDSDTLRLMSLFESATGAKLKDCLQDGQLIFVVEEGEMGKAIGPRGFNVKRIEDALKRKIKIIEFSADPVKFIKGLVYPLQVETAVEEEGIVTLRAVDHKTRGYLIGRNASNLRNYEKIVKRYFPTVKEIKVE